MFRFALVAVCFGHGLVQKRPRFNENCESSPEAALCERDCSRQYDRCKEQCDSQSCINDCSRPLFTCLDACPCHADCPDGCATCDHWSCEPDAATCRDIDENHKASQCRKMAKTDHVMCLNACAVDDACLKRCADDYATDINNCPCGNNCKSGCPCSSFDCDSIKDSILILNNYFVSNSPKLYDLQSDAVENFGGFNQKQSTGSYRSCSFTLNGQMFIVGGADEFESQISVVSNCEMERVGSLARPFSYGACNTFEDTFGQSFALLCFAENAQSACQRYNGGNTVIDASTSNHTHRWISLARLGENIPVAIGGSSSLKVEALEGDNWRDLDDYPFAESYFYLYSTVTFNNDLYIFGGEIDWKTTDMVVKSDRLNSWNIVGNLLNGRRGHRSIIANGDIYHIAGAADQKFERWSFNGFDFVIYEMDSLLANYAFYPESFAIDGTSCEDPQ